MTRATACTVAGVVVVLLAGLLAFVHVPYAVRGPGPVCNTLGEPTRACPTKSGQPLLISVPAADDHPSASVLALTTVSELNDEPSAATALWYWLEPSHAIVPREVVHPPGISKQQTERRDTQDMRVAQDDSVVTAESALHLAHAKVASVSPGSPAASTLKVGDLVLAVDGTQVWNAGQLAAAVRKGTAATAYALTVRRGSVTRTVTLHKAQVDGVLRLGVGLTTDLSVPVTVNLDPNTIGGPSAGLMFALGVYDRLTPGNLAGTAVRIAGTGTIDPTAGAVGPIGGIQQKMYAARHNFHARVFLAPAGDCGDTKGAIPKGLVVAAVSTFDQALSVLAKVKAGQLSDLPHC